MVDINCAWSPALAIQMGQAMAPYHLYWIEEPVATDDIRSAEVARALGTAIAGYETEIGLYGPRINHTTGDRYRATRSGLGRRLHGVPTHCGAGPCL